MIGEIDTNAHYIYFVRNIVIGEIDTNAHYIYFVRNILNYVAFCIFNEYMPIFIKTAQNKGNHKSGSNFY